MQRGLELKTPLVRIFVGKQYDRGVCIDDGRAVETAESWEEAGVVGDTAVHVEYAAG